jgi:hypothetical protein
LTWSDLIDELDRWSGLHRVCTFWWRDDDASEPVRSLAMLLNLAGAFDLQVALAAVPKWATALLPPKLEGGRAVVVQHGFEHRNCAAPGERAIECGGERPLREILGELRIGREQLELLFGSRFLPVLVPPWNRIAEPVLLRLPDLGYVGLSTFGACSCREPISGLTVVNAHIDVLTWRGRLGFAGEERTLRGLIAHLQSRRTGASDVDEPVGLLTHHRNHDEAAWDFLKTLLHITSEHPAAIWIGVEQAFSRVRTPASPQGAAA